jgi:hypothetical protein
LTVKFLDDPFAMADTLTFPLTLTLAAPAYELVPILALALLEMGETWQVRTLAQGGTWEWHYQQAQVRLESAAMPKHSTVTLSSGEEGAADMMTLTVRRIIETARSHEVELIPPASTATPPPPVVSDARQSLLFIAPQSTAFRRLATILLEIVEPFGITVLYPDVPTLQGGDLRRALQEANLVIGVWESNWGRMLLLQAQAQQIPALALMRNAEQDNDWRGATVRYVQPEAPFRAALLAHLRTLLGIETPSTRQSVPLEVVGERDEERRRIYRRVALNRRVPQEQRFHAAQVLANAGDRRAAAEAFGSMVITPYAGRLADEALTMLGTLGGAGQSVLWHLDALTSDPLRALEIARQLVRAGDPQTALFRLERLSQHDHESIRMSALDGLSEIGGLATPRFELLTHTAQDPKVRLRAAQWLQAHSESADQVHLTLLELAQGKALPLPKKPLRF